MQDEKSSMLLGIKYRKGMQENSIRTTQDVSLSSRKKWLQGCEKRNKWPNIQDQQSVTVLLEVCGCITFYAISSRRVASLFEQLKPKRKMPMLDQFHPCIHDFIENIVDVKAYGNCGM